ncbi:MAG: glycine/sarcosine/betaine reductase component B subunit [Actinomycetota bacterium]
MPLSLAAYDVRAVREVRHGEGRVSRTLGDALLEVDLDAVESLIADEPALSSMRAHIARPGDPVRIANVLDAVVPTVKADDPSSTFPGVLGPDDAECGTGATARLRGIAVIATLDMGALIDPEDPIPASYVDMDGPAASLTPWGSTINLVLEMEPSPGASLADIDLASRRVSLLAARELAAGALDGAAAPDEERLYEAPVSQRDLPVVVPILQFTGEGPGLATYLRGRPVDELLPCAIDPRVLLDGGMTCGEYDSPSARNPTALLQTSRLIERLFAEHDATLRLPGAVLTLGYLDDAGEKRRMAEAAADIAVGTLGAEAVICTAYSLGNSHTDTMLTIAASEARGARSVGIVAEEAGLVDHVAEADALISTGNVLQRVDGWTPAVVLGAAEHESPPQIPVLNYLGATTQIGDLHLRGVSA